MHIQTIPMAGIMILIPAPGPCTMNENNSDIATVTIMSIANNLFLEVIMYHLNSIILFNLNFITLVLYHNITSMKNITKLL